MSANPHVSVIMSVYNGASALRESVESILSQEDVDFEFVIVDDGSTDASAEILGELAAAESRIRILRQENQGLTKALIRACAEARGAYIARQDCGDLSLPGRLLSELAVMKSRPETALISCGARVVGPRGEPLYDLALSEEEAAGGLLALDLAKLRGPTHHGSTLFSRDLYERVGGYREQFYFAQDLDLWTRLIEHGRHVAIPEILYQAVFAPTSISGTQRRRQVDSARLILECARMRREGRAETIALSMARRIVPDGTKVSQRELASALYFVGRCLSKRGDSRARRYYLDALRDYPLHLKAAVRLFFG